MWELANIDCESEEITDYALLLDSLMYQTQSCFFDKDCVLYSLDLNAAGLSTLISASNDEKLINVLNQSEDVYGYFSWIWNIPREAVKQLFVQYINMPDRIVNMKYFYQLLNTCFPKFTKFIEDYYKFLSNEEKYYVMGSEIDITPINAFSKVTTSLFSEYFLIFINYLKLCKDFDVKLYKINKDEIIFSANRESFFNGKIIKKIEELKIRALEIFVQKRGEFKLIPKLKLRVMSIF